MYLIVVRHGQSANNAAYAAHQARARAAGAGTHDGRAPRVPEPALTDLGRQQAEAFAAAVPAGLPGLPAGGPTHLYASLMLRAVQTAAPLARALDLPVVLRGDAHEVHGVHRSDDAGHVGAAGMSVDALRAHCPTVVPGPGAPADPQQPWSGGFEADAALAAPRAAALVAGLRAAHGPDDVVVLVTHQHFSWYLAAALLAPGGTAGPLRLRLDNTAHLAVRVPAGADGAYPGGPLLLWSNRSDHLAPADVTN